MNAAKDGFPSVAEYLFSLKAHGSRFGVDRMRALADALGRPQRIVPCVHVAGTNGKGSVSAMLESILRAAGWRTGLYTSPHLVDLGERVQVNRRLLDRAEIERLVAELRPIADRIAASDSDLAPSFFEYLTAMAFLHFARSACDIAIYEVGLGGRLDATNVVHPEVSVITSIGLDHCEILGDTIEQIAAEKAGIIKPGVPIVLGRMPFAAEQVIRTIAARVDAPVRSVTERFGTVDALPQSRLEGEYQRWNAATATLAAETLEPKWHVTADALRRGLEAVEWAGRWERLSVGNRTIILDASHNPEGAEALEANLKCLHTETGCHPIAVVGVLGKARAVPLLAAICRHSRELHLVVPNEPRACSFEELERLIPAAYAGKIVRDTVRHAFPSAGVCSIGRPGDTVIVTGSIYLLGAVLGRIRGGQST